MIYQQIEDFVASNNLSAAIELLKDSKERLAALLLAARLDTINREITIGRLNFKDVNIELNNLRSAILNLANTLQLADESQPGQNNKHNNDSRAVMFYEQDRFSEAIGEFKKLLREQPNNIDVLYKLGRCYLILKSYDLALETFSYALKYDEKSGKIINGMGVAHYNMGNSEGAMFYYGQALLLEPTNQLYFNNKFNLLVATNRINELIQFCSFFIERFPQNPYYYCKRGVVYDLHLNLYEKALRDFDTTLSLDRDNPEYYYQRGSLYSRMDHPENSINDMDKAIALSPDISYIKMKGAIFHDYAKFEDALRQYSKILRLDPTDASIYLNRSKAYSSLGYTDASLKDVNKSIELEPWKAQSYHQRAYLYGKKKNFEAALSNINTAINIDSSNYLYKRYKAALLLDHKVYNDALSLLNEIISSGNIESHNFVMRGICYFEYKKFPESIKDFNYALELSTKECEAYNYLSKIYSIHNNTSLSAEYERKGKECLKNDN